MAAIELDNIVKRFSDDAPPAVADLSLAVEEGECMVLVGPSGCGKTTTLRLVAGLEEPTGGCVRIRGRDVTGVEPHRRDLAMVFQNYALYPYKTVAENVQFPLRMLGVPRTERSARTQEVAGLLGIEDLLGRRPRELSGGQRQRVAMGRALVRRPRAFLMDEPLSNLDAMLRVQMRAELSQLQRRLGITTMYVTHDQTEAMTLGDRIAVLHRGRLQQLGTSEEIYRRPANLFVASFVGSPQMNLLKASLRGGQIVAGQLRIELPPALRAARLPDAAVLGVRPEDLRLVDAGANNGSLAATASVVELLGAETYAYFKVPGVDTVDVGERSVELRGAMVARLEAWTRLQPGEAVELAINPAEVHLFDEGSGQRLRAAS